MRVYCSLFVQVDLANKSPEFCELYATINPDPTAPAKVGGLNTEQGTVTSC